MEDEHPTSPDEAIARLEQMLNRVEHIESSSSAASSDKKSKRARKTEKEEDAELLASDSPAATSAAPTILTEQPSAVVLPMRQYQLEALNWMIRLHDSKVNGILADEMGLGKTCEVLSLLGYLSQFRNQRGPHLVIVPKSTISNWEREAGRFVPSLTVQRFHGDKDERGEMRETVGDSCITLTTYEMCNIEKSTLRKVEWNYIIIDEAHRIKNEQSTLSTLVRTFPSQHRLLVTGTPLQNNLRELWALLNFLAPHLFNDAEIFLQWFNLTDVTQRASIVQRLHRVSIKAKNCSFTHPIFSPSLCCCTAPATFPLAT